MLSANLDPRPGLRTARALGVAGLTTAQRVRDAGDDALFTDMAERRDQPQRGKKGRTMAAKKGKGSNTAKKANAKAAKEGKKNPRKSSSAQAELGKKGAKAKKKK